MPVPTSTDWIVASCTLAIAAATIWQIFYVRIQTANLRSQTDLLLQTIRLSQDGQRAWMGTREVRMDLASGKPLGAVVVLKNAGDSPALNVQHAFYLLVRPSERPLRADNMPATKPPSGGKTTVLPGATLECVGDPLGDPSLSMPLTKEESTAITSGKDTVYLFGRIAYQDAFGRPHETMFGRFWSLRFSAWVHTSFHNEMT